MKYLKLFESFDDELKFTKNELELVEDIEDILLPIKDDGFSINITTPKTDNTSSDGFLRIYIEKASFIDEEEYYFETEPYNPTDTFVPTLKHLFYFLKDNKYKYSIELVGDGGKNTNDTIAYSEFTENDMKLEEMFVLNVPINYIRIIIY
jgi:hypothetical protein